MNKKRNFWVTLVLLAASGLVMAGCPTDSNNDDGLVPEALQGNWLCDSEEGERYLVFTDSRWGTDRHSFADAKKDATWVVTSGKGNKIEYQSEYYPQMDYKGSFNWAINGTKLTITGGNFYLPDDTYTKH